MNLSDSLDSRLTWTARDMQIVEKSTLSRIRGLTATGQILHQPKSREKLNLDRKYQIGLQKEQMEIL